MKAKLQIIMMIISILVMSGNLANAALVVDRSRLIYNEGDKSISVNVKNNDMKQPYLAQIWLENDKDEKTTEGLMALPPLQRVEPGSKTMIRIQELPEVKKLPKDRETLFYFNVRGIPPKSEKTNTLTLALQTRLKLFYRPEHLKVDPMRDRVPGSEKLTLTKGKNGYELHNPTPYYFSFIDIKTTGSEKVDNIEPFMVEPFGKVVIDSSVKVLHSKLDLIFVNDYGSQQSITFSCQSNVCDVVDEIK